MQFPCCGQKEVRSIGYSALRGLKGCMLHLIEKKKNALWAMNGLFCNAYNSAVYKISNIYVHMGAENVLVGGCNFCLAF